SAETEPVQTIQSAAQPMLANPPAWMCHIKESRESRRRPEACHPGRNPATRPPATASKPGDGRGHSEVWRPPECHPRRLVESRPESGQLHLPTTATCFWAFGSRHPE